MKHYQTILCPVDYSPFSIDVLRHAVSIAVKFKSALFLLHVVELDATVSELGIGEEMPDLQYRQLKEFAAEHVEQHVNLNYSVKVGQIGNTIIEMADSIHADLIVMGSHGYSGFQKILLGSNAEYVLEHSTVPLFIGRK